MAKAKTKGPNRSELIRRYIAKHPEQGPKDIRAGMKSEGVNVSMSLVSAVKYKRATVGAKKRRAKAAANGESSKADQIRDTARALGSPVRPRDVIAKLHEKGIEASRAQVSSVLRKMGMRRRRRGKAPAGAAHTAARTEKWTIQDLVAAKKMAQELGGIEKAREALAALSRLAQ